MRLFEPGNIGSIEVKNRVVMLPMGVVGMMELDGRLSPRAIDYYIARARGGAGLIITGATRVEVATEPAFAQLVPRLDGLGQVARLTELCEAVHHYGAKIAVQLFAGTGRVGFFDTPVQPVSASAVPCFWDPNFTTRGLTVEEIEMIVRSFGIAAGICKIAGADGIAVTSFGGYLIDQFLTALWNKRTDQYGGDLDGRMRFPMEIISAIRGAVGEDFPIIYKFTPIHEIEGGRGLEEGLEIAKRLENAGIAALHVTVGCYEVWHRSLLGMYEPSASQIYAAEYVKEVVKIPVIAEGKLGYPDVAERVLQEGKADFVGLGRALLADPEWPEKVRQGRIEDIKPCIADLEGCHGRTAVGKTLGCTVNPITGMERDYVITPAETRKSVLVIGGGPGGLEAARVAALRGHEVVVWEKGIKLGGNMIPASVPGFKQDIRPLIDYFSTQVNKLGVKVVLMKEATPELVRETDPEVVIVATGASPLIPEIPGMAEDNVFSAVDLLLGKKEAGERVIVAGGAMVGCETAVYLAEKGKQVTLIEMTGQLLPEEINLHTKTALLNMIKESRVDVLTSTQLLEVTKEAAVVGTDGSKRQLAADSVVLALGFQPESTIRGALEGKVRQLFAVGDCVRPRRMLDAIWEGFHAGRLI
ncbi:FAD-dependent oxidoreductase [Chloroflexota bacterium]